MTKDIDALNFAEPHNSFDRFFLKLVSVFERPVTFFREKIVEPNQQYYPWYHQKFHRVPDIDQCELRDVVCQFEANEQFRRDKMVEDEILVILRNRAKHCTFYEGKESEIRCKHLWDKYEEQSANWFAKYGDLGMIINAKHCYMKQKHRMIWERRHGPVGSGMKNQDN